MTEAQFSRSVCTPDPYLLVFSLKHHEDAYTLIDIVKVTQLPSRHRIIGCVRFCDRLMVSACQ